MRLDCGYRIDLIVEEKIIVEIKSVASLNATFEAQLLTYMKLTGIQIGYLANFNVPRLIDGLKRMVL